MTRPAPCFAGPISAFIRDRCTLGAGQQVETERLFKSVARLVPPTEPHCSSSRRSKTYLITHKPQPI